MEIQDRDSLIESLIHYFPEKILERLNDEALCKLINLDEIVLMELSQIISLAGCEAVESDTLRDFVRLANLGQPKNVEEN